MGVLSNFRVVLVGTLYSGNVGSVCRAMANMGFSDLVLAAPRLCDDWSEAERMAVHATGILQRCRKTETFEESVSDCSFVVGTTARGGLYRQHVKTPRELSPTLLQLAANSKVALVFGREDKGLVNDEIARCTTMTPKGSSVSRRLIPSAGCVSRICCTVPAGVVRQRRRWTRLPPLPLISRCRSDVRRFPRLTMRR